MSTQTTPEPEFKPVTHFLGRYAGHRGGARPNPSTGYRWITRGVPLPDGTRVRLKAQRFGTKWVTTEVWFREWIELLTAAHLPADGPGAGGGVRSPGEQTRASEKAAAELEAMGC